MNIIPTVILSLQNWFVLEVELMSHLEVLQMKRNKYSVIVKLL